MSGPEKDIASPKPRLSKLALASFYIPVSSLFLLLFRETNLVYNHPIITDNIRIYLIFICILGMVSGLVLGIKALYIIKRGDGIIRGKGFAYGGTSFGFLILLYILWIIISLIFDVKCPYQSKTVLNNCRQLSNAADQYFLEHGVTSVQSGQLIGPGSYVRDFCTESGEKYTSTITTQGIVTAGPLPNGAYITYPEKE